MPAPATPPAPFEIAQAESVLVASNGSATLTIYTAEGGRMFRRRAVKAANALPHAETLLPRLNALAGDLLARCDMPAAELYARLDALICSIAPQVPRQIEWVVAELDGVRVYSDGTHVIVTRQDLTP
jgi:hypothetical protein